MIWTWDGLENCPWIKSGEKSSLPDLKEQNEGLDYHFFLFKVMSCYNTKLYSRNEFVCLIFAELIFHSEYLPILKMQMYFL